jgi:hypothetical protein
MVLGSLAQVQRQSLVTLVTNASQITAYPMAAAILITGANRGLGFEFASQYLADGWRVFAACRNPDPASKLRCLAQDTGGMLNVIAQRTLHCLDRRLQGLRQHIQKLFRPFEVTLVDRNAEQFHIGRGLFSSVA